MNAHTFDSHSVTCPVCNRTGTTHPREVFGGLYTCPYCQARLVVSWSGHYVRDPFTLKQLGVGRLIRRQSRPVARMLRDVGFRRRPSLVAVIAGLAIAGFALTSLEIWMPERNPFNDLFDRMGEAIESTGIGRE
jgi:hypothetical protein